MVVHNQKNEEQVLIEQPIETYMLFWSKKVHDSDCVSAAALEKLFQHFPFLDTKPQIFHDDVRNKYIIYKDPRLPTYKADILQPKLERKLEIVVPRKPVNGLLVPISFEDFEERRKRRA